MRTKRKPIQTMQSPCNPSPPAARGELPQAERADILHPLHHLRGFFPTQRQQELYAELEAAPHPDHARAARTSMVNEWHDKDRS